MNKENFNLNNSKKGKRTQIKISDKNLNSNIKKNNSDKKQQKQNKVIDNTNMNYININKYRKRKPMAIPITKETAISSLMNKQNTNNIN